MKTVKLFLTLLLVYFLFIASTSAQVKEVKLHKAFDAPHIMHTTNTWQLNQDKGENKAELTMDAVEYTAIGTSTHLSGIILQLKFETPINADGSAKSNQYYYAYIDEDEFPEFILVLNNFKDDIINRKKDKRYGSLTYITNDGIKIDYQYKPDYEKVFVTFLKSSTVVNAEFNNNEKFFSTWKDQIDIASKKLYLPENAEKLKKAKKGDSDAKDVKIDDI